MAGQDLATTVQRREADSGLLGVSPALLCSRSQAS